MSIPKISHYKTIDLSTGVTFVLLLHDSRLAICSRGRTIHIVDPKKDFAVDFIIDHNYPATSLCQLSNDDLVSASYNHSIKIYKITATTYRCVFTIYDLSTRCFLNLIAVNSKQFAGSWVDVYIWNAEEYSDRPIAIMKGHKSYICGLITVKDFIISSSEDKTVRMWCMKRYQCVSVLCDFEFISTKNMIAIDDILVIGGKGKLKRVNVNKGKFEEEIVLAREETNDLISLMKINEDVIICGNDQGTLYVCNKEERDSVIVDKMKKINYLIRVDSISFITVTDEIKVWKYNF